MKLIYGKVPHDGSEWSGLECGSLDRVALRCDNDFTSHEDSHGTACTALIMVGRSDDEITN